jgi:hypothetical protein
MADENWLDYLGRAWEGLQSGFERYNRAVPETILGSAMGDDPLSRVMHGLVTLLPIPGLRETLDEPAGDLMQGAPAWKRWEAAKAAQKQRGNFGLAQELGAETLVDPSTYMGFGIAGKLAKGLQTARDIQKAAGAAPKVGKATSAAIKGLQVANEFDESLSRIMGAPIEYPLRGLGTVAKKVGLTALSKSGQVAEHMGMITDALNEAKSLGYRYFGITVKGGKLARYGGSQAAREAENAGWKAIDQEIARLQNPAQRMRALQMRAYADDVAHRWGSETAGEAEVLKGERRFDELQPLWAARHQKVMQLQQSLLDTVSRVVDEPLEQTPEQMARANQIITDTERTIRETTRRTRGEVDAARARLQGQEYWSFVDEAFRFRGQQIRSVLDNAMGQIDDLFYPGARASGQPTFPETAGLRDLQGRMAELESLSAGLPNYFGKMSGERAQTLRNTWPSIERYASFVDRDRARVSRIVTDIQLRDASLFIDDVEDGAELLKRVNASAGAQSYEKKQLRDIIERWNQEGVDLLADDTLDLVVHRLRMDKRAEVGLKGPGPLLGPLQTAVQAFKEEVLLSPYFHEANTIGGVIMGAIKGVPPARVIRNLAENVVNLLRTRKVGRPSDVARLMKAWEQDVLPEGVEHSGIIEEMMSESGRIIPRGAAKTATGRIPTALRVAGSAVMGGLAGGPIGVVAGGLAGWKLPTIVAANRMLAGSIEHALRSTAWAFEKQKFLREQVPEFARWVERELSAVRPAVSRVPEGTGLATVEREVAGVAPGARAVVPAGATREMPRLTASGALEGEIIEPVRRAAATQAAQPIRTVQFRLDQRTIRSIVNGIKALDGEMGPKRLSQILTQNGVDVDDATRIVQRWMDLLAQGDKAGTKLSNVSNFDYARTDQLDDLLKVVFPFVIWPRRSIPFFLRALAEHPGFLLALNRYNTLSEEETAALPRRYQTMARTGRLGDFIAEHIFGVKGHMLTNPFQAIVPFGDVKAPREGAGTAEQVYDLMRQFGFSPGPWVDVPLTMTGLLDNKPYGDVLRHSELVKTLTGRDAEAPWQEALGAVQKAMTGDAPSGPGEWEDYLIQQRLAEMSVEETGEARNWEYVKAMENPNSPLYQQAKDEVRRQQRALLWGNFLQPAHGQLLPEAAEQAYQAQAGMPRAPRNEQGDIGPQGMEQAWQQYLQGDVAAWDQYRRDQDTVKQQSVEELLRYLEQHPLAETYGKAKGPVDAGTLLYRAREAAANDGRSNDAWVRSYLAWLRSHGFDTDEGDVGDEETVQRFLRERGQ